MEGSRTAWMARMNQTPRVEQLIARPDGRDAPAESAAWPRPTSVTALQVTEYLLSPELRTSFLLLILFINSGGEKKC
jgi:hypothetical protein